MIRVNYSKSQALYIYLPTEGHFCCRVLSAVSDFSWPHLGFSLLRYQSGLLFPSLLIIQMKKLRHMGSNCLPGITQLGSIWGWIWTQEDVTPGIALYTLGHLAQGCVKLTCSFPWPQACNYLLDNSVLWTNPVLWYYSNLWVFHTLH